MEHHIRYVLGITIGAFAGFGLLSPQSVTAITSVLSDPVTASVVPVVTAAVGAFIPWFKNRKD